MNRTNGCHCYEEGNGMGLAGSGSLSQKSPDCVTAINSCCKDAFRDHFC